MKMTPKNEGVSNRVSYRQTEADLTNSVKLSEEQDAALDAAAKWFSESYPNQTVFRLFGYAGTGKSTVINALVARLGLSGREVAYVAPTGKAAKVLTRKGCEAKTVHKTFYKLVSSPEEYWNELGREREELVSRTAAKPNSKSLSAWQARMEAIDGELGAPMADDIEFQFLGLANVPHDARLIVVDEASMLEDGHYDDLSNVGLPLILVGDPGQLPPVSGTGKAMMSPDVTLRTIHRQADDSNILAIANLARSGEHIVYGDDGEGVSVRDGTYQKGKIHIAIRKAHLTLDEVASYDQIICGRRATRNSINDLMRKHWNIDGMYPSGAEGEKLIVTRNYEKGDVYIPNGSMITIQSTGRDGNVKVRGNSRSIDFTAKITSIDDDPVDVDGHTIWRLPFEDVLDEQKDRRRTEALWAKSTIQAEWAWAITAHKAQGSQWDSVLLFDESWALREDKAKWLYTAATRAAKKLTIVRL